ncbi:ARM repeat-containing protein [Cantharellus anzutake]|uniref:ARM repeat-containing protein n=1 Tax=Cantharellus anzutake TaxID=1750568 RepID=UPI001905E706|nr:ARM repeat-containing protein [Cantharellus anzutake]KAF8329441.1 ARM repeat-containing protein [Cantharellus anzutake]
MSLQQNYIQRLHELLRQSTAPDTNAIKAATATLNKDFYRSPDCIPGLFEIVATSPEQSIRQIASVELRKRVSQKDGALWLAVPQNIRHTIKSKSLEIVINEPVPIVRHSFSRVISVIAELELGVNQWPELLPWLQQTTSSPSVVHREVGIFVLFTSLETIVDANPTSPMSFIQHFTTLIQDPESLEVRVTTLRAMGILSQYLESTNKAEIAQFQSLIPAMMAVIGAALEKGDTDGVRHGVDVFETFLILETPLLSKHIPQLVEFFTTVGANTTYDDEARNMTLNALTWVIRYKKSKVQSLNLARPILEALLRIGCEEEPEDLEDDSPARVAYRAVDSLATNLPPSQVFQPLMDLVHQYIQSQDPRLRKSALTCFGLAVEGCSEHMRPHIQKIWPLIDGGFQDPVPLVRNATCVAFGCLTEWLAEECAERHAAVMPALMSLMDKPESQTAACTALDAYLEVLGSKIVSNYISLIMERLSGLLNTPQTSLRVKSLVTGAIGSAAHAAGEELFRPYFQSTLQRLQPFFSLTAEGEEQELRGIAMDALGTMAEAIGKENFRPYFADSMAIAMNGVTLGSARLKECSFLFYGVIARVFEVEFTPYLEHVVPALLESCRQTESGEDFALSEQFADGFSTGDSGTPGVESTIDVDDDDFDDEKALAVNSAIAVEKEIAADTLGTIFTYTKEAFLPYLEPATKELLELLDHYYEGIRKSATTSLIEFIDVFQSLAGLPQWQSGLPLKVPLPETVKQLIDTSMKAFLEMWETEDDKSVVSILCSNLAETLVKVGPGLIDGYVDQVCILLVKILERKALCQQDPDQDDADEPADEESAEYETVLIGAACDLVGAIAAVLGSDFSPAFTTFLPLMLKYYHKNKSVAERSASIGSIGEVITGLKGGVTPHTQALLTGIGKAFDDTESEVRSNAAFATGVLIEFTEADLSGSFLPILNSLRPIFSIPPGSPDAAFNARDNAAGAVARMIVKNHSAVPLDQATVLPVLVDSLPLRTDLIENKAVFAAVFHLFRVNPSAISNFLDKLFPVFQYVLDPSSGEQIEESSRAELLQLISALNQEMPDRVAAAGLRHYIS